PAHLSDWGKVAWGRLTVLLDGMGILTVADSLALERLCDIYADILQLRLTIADEGRTYIVQTEGGFLIKANPAVAMLADADRRFKSYLVEFGLTPAARTKVKVDGGEEKEDPLNQFFG
ncbi:phage terminase small subunit P27 family, partial [Salmonella enterica subsp. enterica serovar Montevideo]|nr:phage terminase small subunit P27 family [Salmonella enterica]ECF3547650.1 phage terminase small subunit P27 family [Salmonella enterica subsp. enterica]ECS2565285.1 phage terminase small subunit P27 family [Salmonella enterica subsp. enterica serovar Montevideo]ECJ5186024.1 phage terminase small subunit P27 family [Salmonella enterica subsp. enterica]ECS3269099.1 phage terminase small subunit P27 family [Salmonella enterica subsp. enterica serovar Montevideo]